MRFIAAYIIFLLHFATFSLSFVQRGWILLHPVASKLSFCTSPIAFDDFGTQIGDLDELNADPYADHWRAELKYRINRQRWKERLIERDAELREMTRYRRLSGGDGHARDTKKVQQKKAGGTTQSAPEK